MRDDYRTKREAELRNDRTTDTGVGRLSPLNQLDDYEVADGDPDIRGWNVKSSDGHRIGEVEDLIVDTGTMRARYLEVRLDKSALNIPDDRRVLAPIGTARLDEDDDEVILPLATAAVTALPEFRRDAFNRDYESRIRTGYGATSPAANDRDFYAHEHFDENRFWGARRKGRETTPYITRSEEELAVGKRNVRAGEVDVHKHVETEHVEKEVPVRRDEVTVERRPATSATGRDASIREDEIRVPLMAEEVVTEKRAVPKEEVVIKKHAVQDEKKVEADLRKEKVDVDRKGDVRVDDERRR